MFAGFLFFFVFGKISDVDWRLTPLIFTCEILVLILFMALWYFLNFYVGVAALCLLYNFAFGRTWKFNLIFSAVILGLLYFIFERLLSVQFTI